MGKIHSTIVEEKPLTTELMRNLNKLNTNNAQLPQLAEFKCRNIKRGYITWCSKKEIASNRKTYYNALIDKYKISKGTSSHALQKLLW